MRCVRRCPSAAEIEHRAGCSPRHPRHVDTASVDRLSAAFQRRRAVSPECQNRRACRLLGARLLHRLYHIDTQCGRLRPERRGVARHRGPRFTERAVSDDARNLISHPGYVSSGRKAPTGGQQQAWGRRRRRSCAAAGMETASSTCLVRAPEGSERYNARNHRGGEVSERRAAFRRRRRATRFFDAVGCAGDGPLEYSRWIPTRWIPTVCVLRHTVSLSPLFSCPLFRSRR